MEDKKDTKDINAIKEQTNVSEKHLNIIILIRMFCFQEMMYQKINLQYNKDDKESKNIGDEIIILKKNEMKIYKDFFQYQKLCDELRKKDYQLLKSIKDKNNIINYNKLDDTILLNIIENLPQKLVDTIDKKKKEEIKLKLEEQKKKIRISN